MQPWICYSLFKEENSCSSGREERMDLEKYLFKYVRVETNYGEIIVGYVDMFCTAEENEEPYLDSIGIIPSKAARAGIELDESEIKSIEEI